LSSTTDRRRGEHGQVLVIFAGSLVLLMAIAALVFDVGQNLLDRRTEQNVSDAAALAGARYVTGIYAADVFHNGCAASGSKPAAAIAACAVASESGYVDGQGGRSVRVDMPPVAPSTFSGLSGHIEVSIGTSRASFFAGLLGITLQKTGAMGVATNDSDIPLPYSLLALDPTACGTNKINGSVGTTVTTNGTVHVDSNCPSSALLLSGNGVLTAPECDVVGRIQTSGGAVNNCTTAPTGVLVSGDPLRNLPPPGQPGPPANVVPIDGGTIPPGCPGNNPSTDAAPTGCAFTSGSSSIAGHAYRLFPGNYPGGIQNSKSTVYLSPGIYWIGGGGMHIQTNGVVISKDIGDNSGFTQSGGVLIYNTADPNAAITAACVTSPGGAGCYDDIVLNGGAGARLALLPIQSGTYKNMVIFVDRTKSKPADVDLDGAGSFLTLSGTIYAPSGVVKLNGSDTTADVDVQLICWTFQINGSGASLTINYDPSKLFHLTGVGLVE
jgi:hypothetical protein